MSTCIVGCGGVGSWLAPALRKLLPKDEPLCLIDGDKLESKNLDRQLFDASAIGLNKATALAQCYGNMLDMPNWYTSNCMEHVPGDWLFCCADNNPARMACLDSADLVGLNLVIAANETHSAEAYFYCAGWKDGPLDPRIYYPELLTDRSGDPRAAAIGCTGLAQAQTPQLASANFMAAALAQQLYVIWGMERFKLDRNIEGMLPFKLRSNLTRMERFIVDSPREPYEPQAA